jgi:hypothetical protein
LFLFLFLLPAASLLCLLVGLLMMMIVVVGMMREFFCGFGGPFTFQNVLLFF